MALRESLLCSVGATGFLAGSFLCRLAPSGLASDLLLEKSVALGR